MDENNPTNQEGANKQKLEQLERELENIELQSQTATVEVQTQTPPQQLVPENVPPQSGFPSEATPPTKSKSDIILWVGVGFLLLALIGVGIYFL